MQATEVEAVLPGHLTELMIELLDLKPTDKLLEIGAHSGTRTATFFNHCREIHSLELSEVKYADNLGETIHLKGGDGNHGLPKQAPFDAIAVNCGVRAIPSSWIEQLAENGRLVVPIGTVESQKLTLFMKKNGILGACKVAGYVKLPMMKG